MKKRLSVAIAITVLLVVDSAATAVTFINVSGSGNLDLSATGTVYFDASRLDLSELRLSATQEIVIGSAFPVGVPGVPMRTIDLLGVVGANELSILGDGYFESLEFTGGITLHASRIHALGPITVAGPIFLSAGMIRFGSDVPGDSGSVDDPCHHFTIDQSGAIVLGAPATPAANGCLVEITPGSDVIFPEPPILIIGQPIPEPSAAMLFAVGVGFVSFAVRRAL